MLGSMLLVVGGFALLVRGAYRKAERRAAAETGGAPVRLSSDGGATGGQEAS